MSLLDICYIPFCSPKSSSFIQFSSLPGSLILLFQKQSLNFLFLFSEILFLELEHVNVFKVEIKRIVLLHLIHLTLSSLFQFIVLFFALFDELIDIHIFGGRLNLCDFLFHYRCCSMQQDFLVFVFAQILVCSLMSLLYYH